MKQQSRQRPDQQSGNMQGTVPVSRAANLFLLSALGLFGICVCILVAVIGTRQFHRIQQTEQQEKVDLMGGAIETYVDNRVGDSMRLGQILTNLLGNAVKFTESGHVSLHINKAGEAAAAADSCRFTFSVTDSGIGINEEQMERLFKPFSQADSSTTRQYGGTGLGLVISSRLVEAMGGTLEVTSAPGEGSTLEEAAKEFPLLDGFDLPRGKASAQGKRDTYLKLLQSFNRQITGAFADFPDRIRSLTFEEIHFEAHTIKGVAATLGALRIADAAAAIDRAGTEQTAPTESMVNELREALLCAKEQIAPHLLIEKSTAAVGEKEGP